MHKNNYLPVLIRLYVILFIALQVLVFFAGTPCTPSDSLLRENNATRLLYHSARYDQRHLTLRGVVTEKGDLWFDCFFISTYRLRLEGDIEEITVYTHGATPERGATVTTCGTFRQLYSGKIIGNWCGLIEHGGRDYETPDAIPAALVDKKPAD